MSDTNKRWRARNPQKAAAHILLNNAIRYGRLQKAPCEVCGSIKVHGHHEDYAKPLEVIWLCSKHHRQLHAERDGKTARVDRPRKEPRKEPRPGKKQYQPPIKRHLLYQKAADLRSKGRSYREIGVALGLSKGTVYKWVNNTAYD